MYQKCIYVLVLLLLIGFISGGCQQEVTPTEVEQAHEGIEDVNDLDQDENRVTLVTNSFPPYVMEPSDDGQEGFFVEIVREAFERQGIEVNIRYAPWGRCEELIRSHEVFASFPWSQTVERLESDVFSKNVYMAQVRFLYVIDNEKVPKTYTNLEEVKHLRVGGIQSYAYVNALKAAGFELDMSTSEVYSIEKLLTGRIDLLPVGSVVTPAILEQFPQDDLDQLAYLEQPLQTLYMGLRASATYPEQERLMEAFNTGLQQVVDDGTYDDILEKYNVSLLDENNFDKQFATQKLRVGFTEFAPFTYFENGQAKGISVDQFVEAMSRIGYTIDGYEFVEAPWSRVLEMLKNGTLDIAMDGSYSEERGKYLEFGTEPFQAYQLHFITNSQSYIRYANQRLEGDVSTVGAVRGYSYGEDVDQILYNTGAIRKDEASSAELLDALLNGRYDVVIDYRRFAHHYYQDKQALDDIRFISPMIKEDITYLMFSKQSNLEALRDELDQALRQIKLDGSFQKIEERYLKKNNE